MDKNEAELSREKSVRERKAREEIQTRLYEQMVRTGEALDLKEAHKRCFEGDNSGAVQLKGW
jgi:hypothetical protein